MELSLKPLSDFSVLTDFRCGVQIMDDFIHHNLQSYVQQCVCSPYYLYDENGSTVAFFLFCFDGLVLLKEDIRNQLDTQCGLKLPDTYPMDVYPSIEIEYLAVAEPFRLQGIGTECIEQIATLADDIRNRTDIRFISVSAYYSAEYSAIGFYEKCNFSLLEEVDESKDSIRMFRMLQW